MPNRLPSPFSPDAASKDWSQLKAAAFYLLPPEQMDQEARPSPIPTAWPLLLSKEQLCAYLALSWSTISKICTVAPIDVGVSVVRYSRVQIDEWVAGLPSKPTKRAAAGRASLPDPEFESSERRASALERVRARTTLRRHDQGRCRSSGEGRNGPG
jgi:hypothetical protein